MENLILKSKEIVEANIGMEVDSELIELISLAMSALVLLKPEQTLEKMPNILKELDIIADSRTALDIAHEDLGDYMDDDMLKKSSAAVIREIVADDDMSKSSEKSHLIVSLNHRCNVTEIFCDLIH